MKPLSLLPAIALLLLPLSCKAEDQQDPGLRVFMQNGCFACHGQMGGGGFGPALAGDRMLVLPKFVVAQILIGRGKMPEFGSRLSNEDIAAVAQYVRNSWGNHYGPVSAGDVASVRELMKKASDAAAKAQTPEIH
jgi:mono/diheme cytochrome c family protein